MTHDQITLVRDKAKILLEDLLAATFGEDELTTQDALRVAVSVSQQLSRDLSQLKWMKQNAGRLANCA